MKSIVFLHEKKELQLIYYLRGHLVYLFIFFFDTIKINRLNAF